ncbi:dyn1p [Saccharomyces arboricola H-6]|uniref:Dynein heavy chain, cytoplasmic n=1 Tax=Saccharomyces arboricola (strain H-6 / AS 2.3317 / CBS 10644) TaxID=1160507 RepID=J8PL59_SACAR|nr:dyn1p [Saccharomyces arboricola H-6]
MRENEAGLADELIEFVATTVAGIRNLSKEDEQRLTEHLYSQHCDRFKSFLGLLDGQDHSTLFVLLFKDLDRVMVTIDIGEEMVDNDNLANKNSYSTLLIVKSRNVIVDTEHIKTQINVIYLPGPLNTGNLASIITHGVSSVFDQLVKSDSKLYSVDTVDKTRRKLEDVSKQFQQLHNSIETPDLLAMVPNNIKSAVLKGATSHDYTDYLYSNDFEDMKFLNSLQSIANKWFLIIKETLAIDRDIKDGSVLDEVEFWSNLYEVFKSLIQQTQNQEFKVCLAILTNAKRFYNLTTLLNEGSLSDKFKLADKYNQFLISIPIHEVHQSGKLEYLQELFVTLTSSLKRFRYSGYPVQRFVVLVDKVSQEVMDVMLNNLSNLFEIDYGSFLTVYEKSIHIIDAWDNIVQDLNMLIREDLRKKAPQELLSKKLTFTSASVRATLNQILTTRNRFVSLAKTLKDVYSSSYHEEVQRLYKPFRQINDISVNFELRLKHAESEYSKNMFDLETKLQNSLDNVVGSDRTPIEKLGYLVKFKPLMVLCPRIKVRVQGNQQILLIEAKKEIRQLEAGLNALPKILHLEALNDIPSTSAKISYFMKVQFRIAEIVQYLEALFGSNWDDTLEGRSISTSIQQLRKNTNPQAVFLQWLSNFPEQATTNLLATPILKLIRNGDDSYELKVNFNFALATAYKELRNLTYMSFQVPSHVVRIARIYMNLYPRAINLVELIQTFFSLSKSLSSIFYINVFLKEKVQNTWTILQQVLEIPWESLQVVDSSNQEKVCLTGALDVLEKLIDGIISDYQILKNSETQFAKEFSVLNCFESTASEFHKVQEIISNIQGIFGNLSSKGFANACDYNVEFNNSIISILSEKVSLTLKGLRFPKHILKLDFDEGKITPLPSLTDIKGSLLKDIENLLDTFAQIEFLRSSDNPISTTLAFDSVVAHLKGAVQNSIEESQVLYLKVKSYIKEWKKMGFLWKITEKTLLKTIDGNTQKCFEILTGLLESKSDFELLLSRNDFTENFVLQVQDGQSHIRSKIDFWVLYISKHLLSIYDRDARKLDGDINNDREALEEMDKTFSSLKNIIIIIEAITVNKTRIIEREIQISLLRSVTRTLAKLRMKFPPHFVYIEQLDADFSSLRECLGNIEQELQKHRVIIAQKLEQEVKNIGRLSQSLNESWSVSKPISPTLTPPEALKILVSFSDSTTALKRKVDSVADAAKMLLIPVAFKDQLAHTVEEVKQYELVWKSVETLWKDFQETMEMPWCEVNVPTLEPQLIGFSQSANELPRVIKQFEIYKSLFSQINALISVNRILVGLKDAALKPRHWNMIFRDIGKRLVERKLIDKLEFPLRDVMLLNLTINEALLTKIIQRAQKEFVVEKSLSRIKSFWKEAQYDVKEHSSGLKLVGEWDVLEQACREDLEELISMKNSNYYKIFEQDCLDLESKLTKLSEIQVNWVEVQFYWLDLYGILGENVDIQNFLPLETSKFRSLTSEYKMMTTRAFQLDTAIEVIHIPNFDTTLKLTIDSLKMIKSSLSIFLEKQRRKFPRFYFLGNDDLLKIIGSGKHYDQVSKFMKKMYGSIDSIISSEDCITGVRSLEGEILDLNENIKLNGSVQAQDWLSSLDMEIKLSVFTQFKECLNKFKDGADIEVIMPNYIFQAILLAAQVTWTELVEECFRTNEFVKCWEETNSKIEMLLDKLSKSSHKTKKKIEALLIEYLHFSNITEQLGNCSSYEKAQLLWAKVQKFYKKKDALDDLDSIFISQGGYTLQYKFEYIGIPERLVYTPLLLVGFSALTDSLHQKYGGCFFGPAGTGKTETVKAFGQNLGRMVVVFNCDDSFDYQVISRLLVGITQIGAWGCFDEFNRLDEKVLSAVSANIQEIQNGLQAGKPYTALLEDDTPLSPHTAIFITLNPGYNGRSELPENLRKNFREFSIKSPQSDLIAGIILKILGFEDAKTLASKLVQFLAILSTKCSSKNHYHFGLRTLKSILRNCGPLIKEYGQQERTLVEGLKRVILPSLDDTDESIFNEELSKVFNSIGASLNSDAFLQCLKDSCERTSLSISTEFSKKCLQFYFMQQTQQALILVGKAGCGKTATWKTVIDAMARFDGHPNTVYVIDTKVLTKESIYGSMTKATLEWRDGLFTSILRKVNDDHTGIFRDSRIWIVFDSDLDPEYVEVMNSVLDDNKILTLPNGERLPIPPNFRIIFETDNLDHTTPATITRCGLLWFSSDVCSIFSKINCLLDKSYEALDSKLSMLGLEKVRSMISSAFDMTSLTNLFTKSDCLNHIMGIGSFNKIETAVQLITNLVLSYRQWLENTNDENLKNAIAQVVKRSLLYGLAGDTTDESQSTLIQVINTSFGYNSGELTDYSSIVVENNTLNLTSLSSQVPTISLEAHDVMKPDIIIPTIDTIKHEEIFYDLLNSERAIILCGPPGSGKTMIMNSALRKSSRFDVVGINFSKDTTTEHILSALHRHTNYVATSKGFTLLPKSDIKELVLFCDEINLPKLDEYGSQNVILFLRQLIEKRGFWKTPENKWVTTERIHVIGACNPPTDPGRVPMSERFTRHTAILYLGYPSKKSLCQIYETYYRAIFKLAPEFKSYSELFSCASVHLYNECKSHYSTDLQPHYLFSPRELTRLVRGIYAAIKNGARQKMGSLLRLWAYEAWRIFADRLVRAEEKNTFEQILHKIVGEYFPNQKLGNIASTSLFFSGLLSLDFKEVNKPDLVNFIEERFKTFCDEELEVRMVIHESMIDHILRIDRALKQVQGHMMLIGASRTGKTTLARFVAWLNGLKIVQPKIHRHSELSDFDIILRKTLLNCSLKEARTCLIIDESNILDTAFLERMNTLLANADVPDLFQGEEYDKLMNNLRNKTRSLGLLLDTEQELYDWFVREIAKNLHVILTICDPKDNKSPSMVSSPALFNRCIINWMGDWDINTMSQVASVIIDRIPMEFTDYEIPKASKKPVLTESLQTLRDAAINILIHFDSQFYERIKIKAYPRSPGYFLDGLNALENLVQSRYQDLQENQRFVNVGLEKLNESVLKVNELNKTLSKKKVELTEKEKEARRTLDNMLMEQNESERKREATEEIKKILIVQEEDIKKRKKVVVKSIQEIEPTIFEAQRGVKNIKKQQLTEIRSMSNPPFGVKIVIEAVCAILGYQFSNWRDIQQFIRKDDFIHNIVYYDTTVHMNPQIRKYMEDEFLSDPKFTYSIVNRASKACGPLYLWVTAQITFSKVLHDIDPLREEMKKIEFESLKTKANLLAAEEMTQDLEASIEVSKQKYSLLIRDVEVIKTEMSNVQTNLDRSISLVKSLTFEKERWINSTIEFKKKSQELIGNCIISSIYEAYFGHLHEKERMDMLSNLKDLLNNFGVRYDLNYRFIDYLVTLDEKMKWIECGLNKNDYFLENMSIIMNSNNAVPFLLDPSSYMVTVISNYYGNKTLILSFLEEGFVKRLENAIKFGSVVIIQDGEFFDPIISRLISKEFNHAGNRVTVEIGDHEVDVSSDFKLFLHSCDPSAAIPVFLRSRVRLVDFVTNKESIETRVFDITLTEENAEMQRQREDLIKLNSEYKIKLRDLEKQLLEELNNSQGNMLENDELMITLNHLKREAINIEDKLRESEAFMPQFDNLVKGYSIIGRHSVKLFSMLEKFGQFHWFYSISIAQFLSCFQRVFSGKIRGTKTHLTRVDEILWTLYQEVYSQFSTTLDKRCKMVMAMAMFCLYKFDNESEQYKEAILVMIDMLCESVDSVETQNMDSNDHLALLLEHITAKSYMSAIHWFKNELFVDGWDIADVVTNSANNFFTMASERDVDGTFKLVDLAKASNESLTIIPLGSIENLNYAQEEISRCKTEGGWILLQNVQMSMSWVKTYLYKHIEETQATDEQDKFKLFIACHLSGEKLSPPLLQRTDRFVYEQIPGILDTVKDLWEPHVSTAKPSGAWDAYCRFLLSWFHALITARTRLVPHGFSKKYYFNDCDFQFALVYLENMLVTNPPGNIPWPQVQAHISTVVYGGKIDEEEDLEVVANLCAHVFCGSDKLQIVPGVRIPQPLPQSKEEERARLTKILCDTIEPADSLSSWLQLPREAILGYERDQAKAVASSTKQLLREI